MIPALVNALDRVDFPTLGKPTMPHFKLMMFLMNQPYLHHRAQCGNRGGARCAPGPTQTGLDDKAELQRFELPTSKQSFAEVFREYLESVVLSSYAVR